MRNLTRKRIYNTKRKGVIMPFIHKKKMRNNAFPKGIITPFIKDFHAIHLTLKNVKLIYISTTYLAQTFDLYLHIYVYKVALNMSGCWGKQQQSVFPTFKWLFYDYL